MTVCAYCGAVGSLTKDHIWLVSPTVVKDPDSKSGVRLQVPTDFYRSAITKMLTPNGHLVHTRIVAVGSFYFHLVFPAASMVEDDFEVAANELGAYVHGTVRLLPSFAKAALRSSPQDAISSIVPHLRQHEDTYRRFFRRRKNGDGS